MPPEKQWLFRLEDMLQAIAHIQQFIEGFNQTDFEADLKTFQAVLLNFEILGEASKHIPDDIKQAYANVPWGEMRGMRNIITPKIIWQTIHEDLPSLQKQLQTIWDEKSS